MILGISVDENFIYVANDLNSEVKSYPFAIGRNLSSRTWFIGDEANNENVDNVDIVIDKLFYIMENDGSARIGDVDFKAIDLVKIFFSNLIEKYGNVDYVVVVARRNTESILGKLKNAISQVVKNPNKLKITTYSEAFVAFLKHQETSYYYNTVALFNFTEKALTYYELLRYQNKDDNKMFWKVRTNDFLALPLDLLSGDQGKQVCDKVLMDFAKKCIKENAYSNIILSGLGFEESSSYRTFMTYVCTLANVETDVNFFAKAAILLGKDILDDNFDKNVVIITDARTTADIRLVATVNQAIEKIDIIKAGDEWFEFNNYSFDIIVDNERELNFEIIKVIEAVINTETILIPEDMMKRKDKTNLIEVTLNFTQQNHLEVTLSDKGFGEFHDSTGLSNSKSIEI